MARIAIVEDQIDDFKVLEGYIARYAKENSVRLEIIHFANGLNFLDEYTSDFDVVFMDIEMPHIDGLNTARKLREFDSAVALIFVTNMIQYAINGYEVDAVDFMVKPVSYYNFTKKLEKAFRYSNMNQESHIVLRKDGTTVVMPIKEIYYIDKNKNYVDIHTTRGLFNLRTTISEMEEKLLPFGFAKCYIGCIVNLVHITEAQSARLLIAGEWLPISRRQKKEFMDRFADNLGGI